jgi:glycosyltransferase involved in cell wall biosynthesis
VRVGFDARLAGRGLGVATAIGELSRRLPELGVNVVWFGDEETAPRAVSDVVTPPGPGFPGLDMAAGRRAAGGCRLDLMHFTANSGWWRRGPVPHVLTVHDVIWSAVRFRHTSSRQVLGHAYLRASVPRAARAAAAVAAPSRTAAAEFEGRYGVYAETIANGVDDAWREPRPASPEPPYVVVFAGADPRKESLLAVEAWRRVADAGIGLKLLTGAGMPPGLDQIIDRLRGCGRLEVVPYQTESALRRIVGGALALVYPSRQEGFGLPVLEAMAAGVPVIAGLAPVTVEVGGAATLIIDPAAPADSIAGHVLRLLREPASRAAISEQGRRRAEAFSWDAAALAYRELYARVLAA